MCNLRKIVGAETQTARRRLAFRLQIVLIVDNGKGPTALRRRGELLRLDPFHGDRAVGNQRRDEGER